MRWGHVKSLYICFSCLINIQTCGGAGASCFERPYWHCEDWLIRRRCGSSSEKKNVLIDQNQPGRCYIYRSRNRFLHYMPGKAQEILRLHPPSLCKHSSLTLIGSKTGFFLTGDWQENYKNQDQIATLDCRHEYHAECLKKWLVIKNICPVCKSEALGHGKEEGTIKSL